MLVSIYHVGIKVFGAYDTLCCIILCGLSLLRRYVMLHIMLHIMTHYVAYYVMTQTVATGTEGVADLRMASNEWVPPLVEWQRQR